MIVAITGGTGFIGKRLAIKHLEKGDNVRVLTRRSANHSNLPDNTSLYRGDLTDGTKKILPFIEGADLLYHCAAEINEPNLMHNVHVQGTRNLIGAASGKIGRWIQLSSVGVYGPQFRGTVTEKTPLNPIGVYETTKAESDNLVIEAAARGAITFSMLRPSNVFGPTMTNQSLFQMIVMINKRLFFFIGKPGASANYIHVDNVVEGLVQCGKKDAAKGRIYNLSDHRTIEEFVAIIADELHKPVPRLRLPEMPVQWMAKLCGRLPHFPLTESRVNALTNRSVYSIERIQYELGYVHQVSIEDGLRQMVKAWKQATRKNPSSMN
jgi:nucleoside-diphosphate-sugar epimerase